MFRVSLPEEKKAADEKKDTKIAAADKETKERDEKKAAERRELMIKRRANSPLEGRGPLASPEAVLVRNATVWTSGPEGILESTDVLFVGGKIQQIGKNIE